jgi:NADH-quinone oxidoreductase subunit N
MELSYVELARLIAPEILIVATALVVLAVDLLALEDQPARARIALCAAFASVGCAAAAAWMTGVRQGVGPPEWGMIEVNSITQTTKICILGLGALSMWLARGSNLARHIGECFCLLLLSMSGMMFLVSARDLLTIFVSLELSTLPLYALAAFYKESRLGAQSALKYFLLGSISSATTLFGFSLLYGFSGSISLAGIAAASSSNPSDPLLLAGTVMALGGIGFKIAAAPFHLWAPEVYQNAPLPGAAFIASASKVAGIFILAVVFTQGLGGEAEGGKHEPIRVWMGALGIVAAFSMVVGNLASITQSDARRLLAFSTVAHAGYMLLPLLAGQPSALPAVTYYSATYGLATLGVFVLAGLVAGDAPGCPVTRFNGLHTRSPFLGCCMLVFMLSLAGMPPLAGFTAKFIVFAALLRGHPTDPFRLTLLLLALGAGAVSLYYYLRVLKAVYVLPASDSKQQATPLSSTILLGVIAALVVALGIWPQMLFRLFEE